MSMDPKWNAARDLYEKTQSGEVKLTKQQQERLENLLRGYAAYLSTDTELKRAMVAILYEKNIYLSKLQLLERLGTVNDWGYNLLRVMRQILYEDNDEFQLLDYAKEKPEET